MARSNPGNGPETLRRWNEFQKDKKQERLDAESTMKDNLKVVSAITKPIPEPKKRETAIGKRRRALHNRWDREPINGYSLEHSNIARHVIGLKYAGEAMKEAFQSAAEKYDILPHSVENLFYKKRELFDLAEQEMMELVAREYHQNLAMIRTAMSNVGMRAVDTLAEILDNPEASASVKSKSAVAVLKMLDIDGSANSNPSARVALESLKLVRDVKLANMKEADSHVVDAEDAEVVEEHESEN